MEMWELFLKGLAKTFEDFAVKMIEKGKEGEPVKVEAKKPEVEPLFKPLADYKPRTSPPISDDTEKVRQSVLDVVRSHPEGITMKNIAKQMNVQWHFLRVPVKELHAEGVIVKRDLCYFMDNAQDDVSEPTKPAPKKAKPVVSEKKFSSPAHLDKSVAEAMNLHGLKIPLRQADLIETDLRMPDYSEIATESSQKKTPATPPRRRSIDASQLEEKPKVDPAMLNLSNRDKERLRYRILTALRGRPEGLNLEKLSMVLGMELTLIKPILAELQSELKVINIGDDKFKLP